METHNHEIQRDKQFPCSGTGGIIKPLQEKKAFATERWWWSPRNTNNWMTLLVSARSYSGQHKNKKKQIKNRIKKKREKKEKV